MKSELDLLAEALDRLRYCDPADEQKLEASFKRMLRDARPRLPFGTSLDDLYYVVRKRADEIRRARYHPPTLPPKA